MGSRVTYAIKRVNESILDEEGAIDEVRDGRALAEHEQNCRQSSQRTVEDGKDGSLRQVGEGEHEGGNSNAGGDDWGKFGGERLPKASVGDEVVEALERIDVGA